MTKKGNDRLNLSFMNYVIMIIAVLLVTIGYFFMGKGDISLSPILLIIAYVVVIPISLLLPFKKKD